MAHPDLRRTLRLLPLALLAAACNRGEKINVGAAKYAIESDDRFAGSRFVRVPKRRTFDRSMGNTEMQAWDEPRIRELSDPQLQILFHVGMLHAYDVPVEHQAPVGTAVVTHEVRYLDDPYGTRTRDYRSHSRPSTWDHVVYYRPSQRLADDPAFVPDDGTVDQRAGTRLKKGEVPGWKLVLSRPLVVDVESYPEPLRPSDAAPPGSIKVRFSWRMKPTVAGEPWTYGSKAHRALPPDLRSQAIDVGVDYDVVHHGIVYLRKDGTGYAVVRLDPNGGA